MLGEELGVEQVEDAGRQLGHHDGIEAIGLASVGRDTRQKRARVGGRDAGAAISCTNSPWHRWDRSFGVE